MRYLYLMLALVSASLLGCSTGSNEKSGIDAKVSGEIVLDLIQPGDVHNLFIASPGTGQVSRTPNDNVSSFGHDSSNKNYTCYLRPTLSSPNRNFIAGCSGSPVPSRIQSSPDIFLIAPTNSKPEPCQGFRGKKIVGFVWSPDSKAIAVLSSTTQVSYNPRYWLYALSGHPMQYESYYLNVIEPRTRKVVSFEIPFQTSFGRAQMLEWQQP